MQIDDTYGSDLSRRKINSWEKVPADIAFETTNGQKGDKLLVRLYGAKL